MRAIVQRNKGWLVAGVLLLFVLASQGRVFWRWGGGLQSRELFTERLGWPSAYRTEVALNGGRADLEVFGCTERFDRVVARIGAAYRAQGGSMSLSAGETLACGMGRLGGRVVRVLVIGLELGRRCVVFVIEQSPAQFRQSLRRPQSHLLRELPAYPGSAPDYYVRDMRTRMACAVSTCASRPPNVAGYYRTALATAGWRPAIALDAGARTPNMMMYEKGRELCCVAVSGADRDGGSVVTLVHKEPGVGLPALGQ